MIRGCFLLLIGLLPSLLFADGKSFGRDASSWRPINETEQRAFLACDGVTQRMIVGVSFEAPEQALWLLPVRADAKDVKLDVIEQLPRVWGVDPNVRARNTLTTTGLLLRATLIAPLIVDTCLLPSLNRDRGIASHMEIDRFGVHAELLSADSLEDLQAYLKQKLVNLPDGELASFAPYFDGRHCFVATWVTDANKVLEVQTPGVSMTFPSKELWYPMRATAGYGKTVIPVTLYIDGFVTLRARGGIQGADVQHFVGAGDSDTLGPWLGGPRDVLEYTRIEIDEPAEHYTDDLTFAAAPDARTRTTRLVGYVIVRPWAKTLVVLALLTIPFAFSGVVASRFVNMPARTGAYYGIVGVFTIVALYFAIRHHARQHPDTFPQPARSRFLLAYACTLLMISALISCAGL